ncbi:MAG: hypothetical protein V4649_15030 [Bacteroidota bacterium]
MNDLITYQNFTTHEEAEEVAALLNTHGIDAVVIKDRELLDQNFVGKQYGNYVQLKLKGSDFERARQILLQTTKVDLDDVPADYMLLAFSKDELMDVVAKPDEWGPYNYNLALALLQQKGEAIESLQIEALHIGRKAELSKHRELNFSWYLFGYGFSLINILGLVLGSGSTLWLLYSFYLLPGILGIVLGIYILTTKRTLPDGTRISSFSAVARRHGAFMLALGIVCLLLIIARGVGLRDQSF